MYSSNKGLVIPFAQTLLTPKQHIQYSLFQSIKSGDVKTLSQLVMLHPIPTQEKETLTTYIDNLQTNSFHVPNVLVGSGCIGVGMCCVRCCTVPLVPWAVVEQGTVAVLGVAGLAGTIMMIVGGYKCILYGGKVILAEIKAPYYDYETMKRIIVGG
jgi:hypothetical protein